MVNVCFFPVLSSSSSLVAASDYVDAATVGGWQNSHVNEKGPNLYMPEFVHSRACQRQNVITAQLTVLGLTSLRCHSATRDHRTLAAICSKEPMTC